MKANPHSVTCPREDSPPLAVEPKGKLSSANPFVKSNRKAQLLQYTLYASVRRRVPLLAAQTLDADTSKEKNSAHSVCEGMCSLQRNNARQNSADYSNSNTLWAPVKYNSCCYLDLVKKAPVFISSPHSLNFCGWLVKGKSCRLYQVA